MFSRLASLVILTLVCNTVAADARDGEFLGYTLGHRLRIDDKSLIKSDRMVSTVDRPGVISLVFEEDRRNPFYVKVQPVNKEFDEVLLLITPVSYTVIEIKGFIRSPSKTKHVALTEAIQSQNRFLEILEAKYSSWETENCQNYVNKFGNNCYLIGPRFFFNFRIDPGPELFSLVREKRDYWELEMTLRSTNDDLHNLAYQEGIKKTDKTGL